MQNSDISGIDDLRSLFVRRDVDVRLPLDLRELTLGLPGWSILRLIRAVEDALDEGRVESWDAGDGAWRWAVLVDTDFGTLRVVPTYNDFLNVVEIIDAYLEPVAATSG